jgi:hypothetical protein
LRQYSKTVEKNVLDVENASIQDYILYEQYINATIQSVTERDTLWDVVRFPTQQQKF